MSAGEVVFFVYIGGIVLWLFVGLRFYELYHELPHSIRNQLDEPNPIVAFWWPAAIIWMVFGFVLRPMAAVLCRLALRAHPVGRAWLKYHEEEQ